MNLQDFHSNPEVSAAIAKAVEQTLTQIGEDPHRAGLVKTPHRVGEALQYLCKGYNEDAEGILRSALFEEDYRQMVVVKDIDFYSLCEHHMLPFFGKVHVAYIPNGRITGLSKNTLNPLGVMVVIEAEHLCMQMRGVQKQHAMTVTSDFTGAFNRQETRDEFLKLIGH